MMAGLYYTRDPKTGIVRQAEDVFEFGAFFRWADRSVSKTQVTEDVKVSTVFLGIDHNFYGDDAPIVFETLVFGGPLDGEMERYATEEEARAGHEEMVKRVRDAMGESIYPTGGK